MKDAPRVTVGIPFLNEEAVIPELTRRLGLVLKEVPGGPHEVIFVDDGSTDRTAELLAQTSVENASTVLIRFSRNFGHQAALSAALEHGTGDVTVLMDSDLQDPPEAIPEFLRAHAQGYDVVYARRATRTEPWYLRLCYFLFYRVIHALSEIPLPLDTGDFSLLSRRVVEVLKRAPERHRYLRGLRAWAGFKQVGLSLERGARFAGKPKYSLARLVALALDGVFAFSIVPLRLATLVGAFASAGAAAFGLYSLWARFFHDEAPKGFTALILAIVFTSGVQLFFLGIIGEYMGRSYHEVKGRPQYVVEAVTRKEPGVRSPGP